MTTVCRLHSLLREIQEWAIWANASLAERANFSATAPVITPWIAHWLFLQAAFLNELLLDRCDVGLASAKRLRRRVH